MNKQVCINGFIKITEFTTDAAAITLLFKEGDVGALPLTLLLLDYELVQSVTITHKEDKKTIALSLTTDESSLDTPIHSTKVSIRLSRQALQAVISFLLQYHRDGYWAANHVDIELGNDGNPLQGITLTVQTDQAPKAISSEVAKKLLGRG